MLSEDFNCGDVHKHGCPCGNDDCYILRERYEEEDFNCRESLNSSFIDESSCEGHYSDRCPYISQSFSSDIEAYNFYASFAKKNGFSIRRGHSLGSREHQLGFYKREFLCHRAGETKSKKVAEVEHQRDRKSTRCNCEAKMVVSKDVVEGISHWKIMDFSNIHNHELLTDSEIRFLPAYRNIDNVDQKQILILSEAGCNIRLIMRVLELEKGVEPGGLPFTDKDVRNFIQSQSYRGREDDASNLLKICKTLKDQDATFSYDFTIDKNKKLEHIAWSFGDSVRAYEIYGDVVVFDTTYRINRYDMPLGGPFYLILQAQFLSCLSRLHCSTYAALGWTMLKVLYKATFCLFRRFQLCIR